MEEGEEEEEEGVEEGGVLCYTEESLTIPPLNHQNTKHLFEDVSIIQDDCGEVMFVVSYCNVSDN